MESQKQNIAEVLQIVGSVINVIDGYIRVQRGYMMVLLEQVVLDVVRY